jgi:hypothetical protein
VNRPRPSNAPAGGASGAGTATSGAAGGSSYEVGNLPPSLAGGAEGSASLFGSPVQLRLPDGLIEKALAGAGIAKSDLTMEIVDAMIRNNLPLTGDTIAHLLSLAGTHKQIPVETLVVLHRLGLPPTDENAKQLYAFIAGGNMLSEKLDGLIMRLSAAFAGSVSFAEAAVLGEAVFAAATSDDAEGSVNRQPGQGGAVDGTPGRRSPRGSGERPQTPRVCPCLSRFRSS